ncbi:MAG: transcription antitermination factor NusB [Candidatus Lightella neohaematopini]|nr:transcription antitermination factor NusB [Candidatus Lightella neohaematopini]
MKQNRRKARIRALQALYSLKIVNNVNNNFIFKLNKSIIDVTYFYKLYLGVLTNYNKLDNFMLPYLSRDINKLDYIEHTILRIAIFELIYHSYIPYKVVINEAIELTKIFGTNGSYKFINGVLDKIINKINIKK